SRLGEVESTEQLANKENVHVLKNRGFQRRAICELRKRHCRTEIGKSAELLAETEQASFRTLVRREVIKLRRSHGAEKDSIAVQARFQSIVRQRRAGGMDGGSADEFFFEMKFAVLEMRHGLENANSFMAHFRAHSITR